VASLEDLAIHHLVFVDEMWLLCRADFGLGGQWWHLHVAILLKASRLQPLSPRSGCSKRNLRSGFLGSDDSDMWRHSPPRGSFLEQALA
jgi:hypothetical protein